MDIIRVADKLKAFRQDFPAVDYGLIQSFTEDHVGDVARVTGSCRVVDLHTGAVLAEAHGTRALRPPVPGAQGSKDTRDPDRAMTQALGRVLGLLGYADAESIEGDTDLPDHTAPAAAAPPRPPAPPRPRGENPATQAKKVLNGEAMPEPEPDPDLVDASPFRDALNGLDSYGKGTAKSMLDKAGIPVPIPARVAPETAELLRQILAQADAASPQAS